MSPVHIVVGETRGILVDNRVHNVNPASHSRFAVMTKDADYPYACVCSGCSRINRDYSFRMFQEMREIVRR